MNLRSQSIVIVTEESSYLFYSGTLWNADVITVYLRVSEMMLLDASERDVLATCLTHDVDVEAA